MVQPEANPLTHPARIGVYLLYYYIEPNLLLTQPLTHARTHARVDPVIPSKFRAIKLLGAGGQVSSRARLHFLIL
jgi:hypothetical protein